MEDNKTRLMQRNVGKANKVEVRFAAGRKLIKLSRALDVQLLWALTKVIIFQGSVVQKLDKAIHWINHHLLYSPNYFDMPSYRLNCGVDSPTHLLNN